MSGRFVNYEKDNPQSQRLVEFSDENKPIFSNSVKSSLTNRPSWIANFLHKHRSNFSTNKHIGSLSFFSNIELLRSQYGAVASINSKYPSLSQIDKTYISEESIELSSKQYETVSQPRTDFDSVELLKAQETVPDVQSQVDDGFFQAYHKFGDASVFSGLGYKKVSGLVQRFYELNSQRNSARVVSGALRLNLGAMKSDVVVGSALETILSTGTVTRELDYKEKVEATQVRYLDNQSEWVLYLVEDIKDGVISPDYIGYVQCLDKNGNEIHPSTTLHFPSVIISGVYEPAKVICKFTERSYTFGAIDSNQWKIVTHNDAVLAGSFSVAVVGGSGLPTRITWVATSVVVQYDSDVYTTPESILEYVYQYNLVFGRQYEAGILYSVGVQVDAMSVITTTIASAASAYGPVEKSGKISFYSNTQTIKKCDQSKFSYPIAKSMINGGTILTTYMHGIDFDIERNRRSYATVMNQGWNETAPIGNGYPIDYAFVNRNGVPVKFDTPADYKTSPGIYLKVNGPLSVLSSINDYISKDNYNDDVISYFAIKNPRVNLGVNDSVSYGKYDALKATNPDQFFDRQNHFLYDMVGGTRDGAGVVYELTLPAFGPNAAKFSGGTMKVCGCGFKTEIIVDNAGNITGDEEYLVIYVSNYSEASPGKQTISLSGHINLAALSAAGKLLQGSREKVYPLLRLPGVQGYVKLLSKNTTIPRVFSAADAKSMIYNIEFPYAPGSFLTRSEMNYRDASGTISYRNGFIHGIKFYTPAGSEAVFTSGADARSERANERVRYAGQSGFAKTWITADSTADTYTSYAINGGGIVEKSAIKKSIKYWPDCVKKLINHDYVETATADSKAVFINPKISGAITSDLNIYVLIDNRRWVYDQDKYAPYFGKENPSYVLEINAESVIADNSKLSLEYRAAPDRKRFLFTTAVAQAFTESLGSEQLASDVSDSDIAIEVWDKEALVAPGVRAGSWRRISPSVFDTDKIPSQKVIISNLAYKDIQSPGYPIQTAEFCEFDMYYYEDAEGRGVYKREIPPEYNNTQFFNNIKNAVFYDKRNEKSYHLVDIRLILGVEPYDNFVRVKLRSNVIPDVVSDLILDGNKNFNVGEVDIRSPLRFISKGGDFVVNASRVETQGVPKTNLVSQIQDPEVPIRAIRRYMDLREIGNTSLFISDFDRFFEDDIVKFRIRVNRANSNPISWTDDGDVDEFQYFDSYAVNSNNPFVTAGVYDSILDWNKITLSENITKIGLGYFALASR
jgi:hypothetical protein